LIRYYNRWYIYSTFTFYLLSLSPKFSSQCDIIDNIIDHRCILWNCIQGWKLYSVNLRNLNYCRPLYNSWFIAFTSENTLSLYSYLLIVTDISLSPERVGLIHYSNRYLTRWFAPVYSFRALYSRACIYLINTAYIIYIYWVCMYFVRFRDSLRGYGKEKKT